MRPLDLKDICVLFTLRCVPGARGTENRTGLGHEWFTSEEKTPMIDDGDFPGHVKLVMPKA